MDLNSLDCRVTFHWALCEEEAVGHLIITVMSEVTSNLGAGLTHNNLGGVLSALVQPLLSAVS